MAKQGGHDGLRPITLSRSSISVAFYLRRLFYIRPVRRPRSNCTLPDICHGLRQILRPNHTERTKVWYLWKVQRNTASFIPASNIGTQLSTRKCLFITKSSIPTLLQTKRHDELFWCCQLILYLQIISQTTFLFIFCHQPLIGLVYCCGQPDSPGRDKL